MIAGSYHAKNSSRKGAKNAKKCELETKGVWY